jgi:hypothetical protein
MCLALLPVWLIAGSNLGPETILLKFFMIIPQSLEANAGMLPVPLVKLYSLHLHILSNSLLALLIDIL